MTGVLADRFPAELHLFRSYQPTLDKPVKTTGNNERYEEIKPPNGNNIFVALNVLDIEHALRNSDLVVCKQQRYRPACKFLSGNENTLKPVLKATFIKHG